MARDHIQELNDSRARNDNAVAVPDIKAELEIALVEIQRLHFLVEELRKKVGLT